MNGGARAIQLRDKTASSQQLYDTALRLRALTRTAEALLFVNDRFDVALAADADGVHLGPDDLSVGIVRRAVPASFLIGYSTDRVDVAKRAAKEGVDYIGCGAVFPTTGKQDAGEAIGITGLEAVVRAVPIPVIGIGGITVQNVGDVMASGAAGVAVIGAVLTETEESTRGLMLP